LLIAIEGTDASGKATQTRLLAERIRDMGREVVTYSFPRYDTPIGKTIKRLLTGKTAVAKPTGFGEAGGEEIMIPEPADEALVLQALMTADKADATEDIATQLNEGTVVICDRWIPSAICYGAADGLDREWLRRINFPLPDAALSVFIDVSPEEALRRRPKARDRYERDREKQERVHEEYVRLWGCEQGQERIVLAPDPFYEVYYRVNGERSEADVSDLILKAVLAHRAWEAGMLDAPPPRGDVS
jgi:dTMP kinase